MSHPGYSFDHINDIGVIDETKTYHDKITTVRPRYTKKYNSRMIIRLSKRGVFVRDISTGYRGICIRKLSVMGRCLYISSLLSVRIVDFEEIEWCEKINNKDVQMKTSKHGEITMKMSNVLDSIELVNMVNFFLN
ncbi:unnamed protein product [Pylaiella littoralis]